MQYHVQPELEVRQAPPVTYNTENQGLVTLGYTLLGVSFAFFIGWDYLNDTNNYDPLGAFIVHYLVLIVYAIFLFHRDALGWTRCWKKENIDTTVILLNLALVSAYALNRSLPVFERSVEWLCGYLVISSLTLLSYRYIRSIPVRFRGVPHFLLGAAAMLYLYMTLYTLPLYIHGAIGMILLGVGGHIFLPAALLTVCLFLVVHHRRQVLRRWFVGGALSVILFTTAFVVEWNSRAERIEQAVNQSVLNPTQELPVWIRLAQALRRDWITLRLLKAGLVYTTIEDFGRGPLGRLSWDEVHRHDPLVLISALTRKTTLSREDRIKALQAISDSRHRGQERLWRGDNLATSYVVSDVDIYPALRLAYTEKYLNIRNNNYNGWWGNTQEAIYTFQLPEGAVVTSLSLWIDGREQKGILTAKNKAAQAYRQVVGVERRDPSVVHWQEGNTVTVRVFPCTPQEERKFKIGVTSPLAEKSGTLCYRSMTFQGPASRDAHETYRVRFPGYKGVVKMPRGFTRHANGDFLAEHDYDPGFELSIPATPIPENHFTFDGYTYTLTAYKPEYRPAQFKEVYLDINAAWTDTELSHLHTMLDDFQVYVFAGGEALKLDENNWKPVTDKMRRLNFSLFPFHSLKDEGNTLVITKGRALSPHLSDISDSRFAQGALQYMSQGKKAMVFNLSGEISTYIGSLREFRAIDFAGGEVQALEDLLKRKVFPVTGESAEKVVLHDAGLVITKSKVSVVPGSRSNAPDHLARLFAYNDVMRKVGMRYFSNDYIDQNLVDEATSAYVVSPVSSLIVLEKQADYERFGIADAANSLHNAAKDSQGAVPEPHEWALIILFLLFVIYAVRRRDQHSLSK